MAQHAVRTWSLLFIGGRMNSEVCWVVFTAHIQPNDAKLMGQYFTFSGKHTGKTRVSQVKEMEYSSQAKSVS